MNIFDFVFKGERKCFDGPMDGIPELSIEPEQLRIILKRLTGS